MTAPLITPVIPSATRLTGHGHSRAGAARRLPLANPPGSAPPGKVEAVLNATDMARQRQRWAAAGVAQPSFRAVPAAATPDSIRRAVMEVGLPCVVKAVSLSAGQGILRADDPAAALAAAGRIRHILAGAGVVIRNPCWSRRTRPARS